MGEEHIDRIQVDLRQLDLSLSSLAQCEDVLADPAEPIGPGSFRGLDGVGALGPVHDAEIPARFDLDARRALSTLEALLSEHATMLRRAIDNISASRDRYNETEPILADRIKRLIAELGDPLD